MLDLGGIPFHSHRIYIKKLGFFLAIICSIYYYRLGQRKVGARTSKLQMDFTRIRFVLFGDSITEQSFRPGGWGAALANTYARKNCSGAPVVTTIFFGANDAAILDRASERQHVPVEEYKENLRKVVHHLKEWSPTMLVILITPPPIDEEGRNEYARSLYGDKARVLPERTNEMAGVYAKNCVELAKELSLPYVDLWSHMQETVGWQKKFLSDGLHLTPEGNAVVHKEVVGVLQNAHLSPEDLSFDFPHHSLIDGKNPEMAFI